MTCESEKKLEDTVGRLKKEIEECKQMSAQFQSVFDTIPDPVVITDLDRRIVMVNPAVESVFGFTREEVIGQNTAKFYASKEDYEEQGRIRYNLSVKAQLEPYKVKYRRKNNQIFLSETVGRVVRDEKGNIIGYLALMRDITEQEESRKNLEAAELNYRTVADFTYDWEYWSNPDGSLRYVSPACERITGYPPNLFIQNHALLEQIIVPEDKGIWEKHCEESETDIRQRELQFRITRRDGGVRWIEHACQPVQGGNNELLGYRASNRDITERKKVENQLRQALDEITVLKEKLDVERSYLLEEINLEHNYTNIIGNSNALHYVLFKIEQIAPTDTSVLILGETGTGKELIARAIHSISPRNKRSLVKINCAALPANLIESELFGHEKGAFTGAYSKHAGRFEVADGGTIFLDEIGEMPLELQAKLLRVLQDGELERLGSSRTIKVDVRVIAATNRHLEEDVKKGLFRQDLWYRLNVFPITAPPLRDRLDDVPLLAKHFVEHFSKKQGKKITSIPASVMKNLVQYSWPGNIRELENVIERAVINTSNSKLHLADSLNSPREQSLETLVPMDDMERSYILKVLDKVNWKVSGNNSAAEILKLDRSTLRSRMKKLGIVKPYFL